jgi:hypothetical protein
MKIEVRFRGLEPSDALREHTSRRVHFHLGRFGEEVTAVLLRIGDINGPRGGLDKRCQVTVRGPRIGSTTLHHLDGDAQSAVDVAVDRARRTVRRALDRLIGDARGTPPLRRWS